MVSEALQNLTRFDKLVNADGTPTDFFMRLLQGKDAITVDIETAVTELSAFEIDTGAPITGGPVAIGSAPGISIGHADSGVTAATKGTATKVAVVTVDAKGHVTALTDAAIDFTVEVADEGGSLGIFNAIDFAGAGVTATDAGGGVALVTIPGGGGSGSLLGAPWTIPVIASFTGVNVGALTATDRDSGICVYNPATDGFAFRGWLMAAGGATFTLYARFKPDYVGFGNNSRMGLVIANSTGPRRVMIGPYSDAGGGFNFRCTRWNGTTYNSETAYGGGRNALSDALWVRIDVDATNIKTYIGNGYDWVLHGTEAIATFINGGGGAIDEVGFGSQADGGSPTLYQINSFSLTAPATGGGGQV